MSPPELLPMAGCIFAGALLFCLVPLTHGSRPPGNLQPAHDDYKRLFTHLFDNYSRDIRPVVNFDEATLVHFGLYLVSVMEVNEKEQTIKTYIKLQMDWKDVNMEWSPPVFQGIESILRRQGLLWLPDVVVDNSVAAQEELGFANLMMRVTHQGFVLWYPTDIFETGCTMDITYYPFDTQVCDVIFKTAVSLGSELNLSPYPDLSVDLSQFSPNSLWNLLDSALEFEDTSPDTLCTVTLKLLLQRRRSFYVFNIILPILFLSLTSSLTFALPSDAGEKMGLSITILLAYAVYLTLVSDAMPDSSTQVSVVMIYLIVLLMLSALSVILSVFILRLHHRPPSSPVTGCLATVAIKLRSLLRMETLQPGLDYDDSQCHHDDNKSDDDNTEVGEEGSKVNGHGFKRPRSNSVSPAAVNIDTPQADDFKMPRSASSRSSSDLDTALTLRRSKVKWVSGAKVAETLDQFIFFLFALVSVGSTAVCLIVLPLGGYRQQIDNALTNSSY